MHQPHKLADMGSTPIAVTTGGWCNGNIRVSKTFVLGSNPSPLAYGAVDKLVKSPAFHVGVCGFDSRQHCYCPAVNIWAVRRDRYWQSTLFAKQS